MENITIVVWNLVYAILILVVGYWAAKNARSLIRRILERREVDHMVAVFSSNITYLAILIMIVIGSLSKLGFNTNSLVAIFGASGIAVALALQSNLSHFAAGVILVLFRPFTIGDIVEISGKKGTVATINFFSTKLLTCDNRELIVPNGLVISDVISNLSSRKTRRTDLVIGIAYESSIKHAKEIMLQLAKSDVRVLTEPAPVVLVDELADSSVNLMLRYWVAADCILDVKMSLTENIKVRFDEQGIEIPYPRRHLIINDSDVADTTPKKKKTITQK